MCSLACVQRQRHRLLIQPQVEPRAVCAAATLTAAAVATAVQRGLSSYTGSRVLLSIPAAFGRSCTCNRSTPPLQSDVCASQALVLLGLAAAALAAAALAAEKAECHCSSAVLAHCDVTYDSRLSEHHSSLANRTRANTSVLTPCQT